MNLNLAMLMDMLLLSLVSVAYLTLLERKILGYSQYRKGPNKPSLAGLIQPISDAVKLATKESVSLYKSSKFVFFWSPVIGFSISAVMWVLWEFSESVVSTLYGGVYLLLLLSFGIYPMMTMGWSSNSKYSLVGAIRSIAQTISYEISLALIMLSFLVLSVSLSFKDISVDNVGALNALLLPILGMMWFISCLAETNRTPFDFSEGESELVSGFNTEYGSVLFTLIFLGEYLMILFFSLLVSYLLLSPQGPTVGALAGMVFVAFVWVWSRSTFPRYRYDKLMNLAWKSFLPASLAYVVWAESLFTLI